MRALAPLTPRPEVLPRPEHVPRPTLALRLWAPGLLRISLSFIYFALLDDLDEMLDGADHAAHGRRILERTGAADLAQTQPAQRGFLFLRLAVGAAHLAHRHRLAGFFLRFSHGLLPCRLFDSDLLVAVAFAARNDFG